MKSSKALMFLILIGCLLASQTQRTQANQGDKIANLPKDVKVKYDKSKDLTTVTLKSMAVSSAVTKEVSNLGEVPQLDLEVWFTYPGQQLSKPADATMRFKSRSRYPVYQRGQNLMLVLNDDRAIPLGTTTYKSNSQTFQVEEILTASVPYEAMKRMSETATVRIFLGPREIKLKEEQHESLRDLTKLMAP